MASRAARNTLCLMAKAALAAQCRWKLRALGIPLQPGCKLNWSVNLQVASTPWLARGWCWDWPWIRAPAFSPFCLEKKRPKRAGPIRTLHSEAITIAVVVL